MRKDSVARTRCTAILKALKTCLGCHLESTELTYEVLDRIAVVSINRPERMNTWTLDLEQQFEALLECAKADSEVRCVVFTGVGEKVFCAGMDIQSLGGNAQTEPLPSLRFDFVRRFPKPLVAAINGSAAGVGLCLALYCDIRYVCATAKLTLPYARRGLVAEHGLAWMLPRLIGPMHAAELLLTGRAFTGEQAAQMGMCIALPREGFMDAVMASARDIANLTSPRSTQIIKRQLWQANEQTFDEAARIANQEIDACKSTADLREGIDHFIQKRQPNFTGE